MLVPLFLETPQLPAEEIKPLEAAERTLRPRATTSGLVRPSGRVEPKLENSAMLLGWGAVHEAGGLYSYETPLS